ncbi:MAG: tyrosine-protein phosphatase, partial [Bacilli bacterium]|nr:tyrosine-protein phosphatase [Bacilli bacterium]
MKNFRELAYSNMKKGLLFRSDVLFHLNPKEKALLRDSNIKVVIDLRGKDEVEHLKDTNIKAINFINLPMLPESDSGNDSPLKTITIKHMTLPDMDYAYRQLVMKDRKEVWSKIFNILLNNKEGAVLFHCSAGKDRTGVVSAIILTALGIDRKTVYNDYLITNEKPLYYKKMAL